ncbi:GNAT family N-acetyltransferase [Streptomyces sp. NPDC002659]|uniref:GNAT family N-acetyltransferase n=1 Tax=Streptomyces sp. NPDC002659 TaxID=3364656 RepID=UPI00367F44AA
MWIRDARPDEADALTALVLRSKAHWGYDEAFLAACRDELAIQAGELAARRIVVAENDTAVLGVASLEGEPPHGALGLLFVEPSAIGRGIGRTLYAHVLDTARELGFKQLTVESDPHAEPFYRAMGARPVPEAGRELPLLEVTLTPRAAWAQAWTDGRRAVHLGNVAEFQGQFGEMTDEARRAADHYACLAAFASPHPAALVLPGSVPGGWIAMVARQLCWSQVEVYDDLTGPDVLARSALLRNLRALQLPFVPWGHTEASGELSGRRLPPDALRYESKRASHTLFRRLAPEHPAIVVPERWTPATRREAARLIAARARAGAATVVKTEHGAGGSGTRVLTGPARARTLPRGPLLLEEFITGDGTPSDPTYDGLVDARGEVHDVGVAAMDVEGTVYRGATVGSGAVPDDLASHALRFGHAVGQELAATGYRGWFDVDFVTGPDGRLAPTEINLRLTGPSAAFIVKLRLDELRGGDHLVRSLDRVPLGARLPEPELILFLRELTDRCAGIDAHLVPSIPTAGYEPDPYVGVLIAARTAQRLDAAEALVRAASLDLGRIFG